MKNITVTLILVLLLGMVLLMVFRFVTGSNGNLISSLFPSLGGNKVSLLIKPALNQPTPSPTPSYNLPEEVVYGNSTDLKLELQSINPQVLDSDFF